MRTSFTGFYWVLLGFGELDVAFSRSLPDGDRVFTDGLPSFFFSKAFIGFTGFSEVLPRLTQFLPGLTEFYWVLLAFMEFFQVI